MQSQITHSVVILVALLKRGKAVSFPLKSLILLFVFYKKNNRAKISTNCIIDSFTLLHKNANQEIRKTYKSVKFVKEAMPGGIGPLKPLPWITLP